MDYALAKELKDAGFPWKEGDWYTADGEWIPEKEREYAPTLEELIEACGNEFLGVHRVDKKSWYADTHTHLCNCGKPVCNGHNWEHETGATPTEAVARLWLALKKS